MQKFAPVFVFLFALAVRLYYILSVSQNRLASFGDGYFFLKTGQELAKAITMNTGFQDFLAKITLHTSTIAGGVTTFGSGFLGDRLLLDGPIYTCFLAFVQIAGGITSTNDFAAHSTTFAIANAVVDSISCLLVFLVGRMAFGWRTALCAAVLLAVYPPSVLNTRLCYSELFTYFLLLIWTYLVLFLKQIQANPDGKEKAVSLATSFALGVTYVILILARSVFSPLPLLTLAIVFAKKPQPVQVAETETRSAGIPPARKKVIAFLCGIAISIAPWLWFTHAITGKLTPWVNRAPGYNLYVGNQLDTDGWRTWPAQTYIATETSAALHSVATNFSNDPPRFTALILRKVARLWAGVWNDFQHKFCGINWTAQNVFHDLLILIAAIGVFFSFRPAHREKLGRPAAMFALIAVYHSIYALFEPVARYAITAMPFVCLLAGQGLVALARRSYAEKSANLVNWCARAFVLFYAAGFFALLDLHVRIVPLILSITRNDDVSFAYKVDTCFWIAGWLLLGFLLMRLLQDYYQKGSRAWQTALLWLGIGLLATITLAGKLFDPARYEWFTELKTDGDRVEQQVRLPARHEEIELPAISFLIADMQTKLPSNAVRASVNGVSSEPPVLLYQITDRKDAPEIFSLQAQAMNIDPRSFRHWWVFPIQTSCLKFGDVNKIELVATAPAHCGWQSVRVFGDYPQPGNVFNMPSMNKFSWVKGFVTVDRRDPRPYEKMIFKGTLVGSMFATSKKPTQTTDLSASLGRQFGSFRLRLYVPPLVVPLEAGLAKQKMIFHRPEETLAIGGDPRTMIINQSPIAVSDKNSCRFYQLSTQLQCVKNQSIGSVSVTFKTPSRKWSSPWTPTSFKLNSKEWQQFVFIDRLPDDIKSASALDAEIMIAPFSADRLFLHKKEALRDSVKIRNVELQGSGYFSPTIQAIDSGRLY